MLQSDGSQRLSSNEFQAIGPQQRRPDGGMCFVEIKEHRKKVSTGVSTGRSQMLVWNSPPDE